MTLDEHGQPRIKGFNWHHNFTKSVESLLGLCKGLVHPRVVAYSDYLVIGTLASRDWAHTSHGRKIESAIKANEEGSAIKIIAEEDWTRFL